MADHLASLAIEAADRVESGYYNSPPIVNRPKRSLREAIINCTSTNAVIAEVKYASPSHGRIRSSPDPARRIAENMVAGGACALSVLTAPDSFDGSLAYLASVAESVQVPLLMKDIIVSPIQLLAGAKMGADAAVLIAELYANGLSQYSLSQMRSEASKLGLEVLIEACSQQEFAALRNYRPDIYGVNNRNLSSLKVNLSTTIDVLESVEAESKVGPIVSESGIETSEDLRRLKLAGADAFLIGTSIMRAEHLEDKVREFVNA